MHSDFALYLSFSLTDILSHSSLTLICFLIFLSVIGITVYWVMMYESHYFAFFFLTAAAHHSLCQCCQICTLDARHQGQSTFEPYVSSFTQAYKQLGIHLILEPLGTKKNAPCQANRCNFKLLSSWCPAPCLIVSQHHFKAENTASTVHQGKG